MNTFSIFVSFFLIAMGAGAGELIYAAASKGSNTCFRISDDRTTKQSCPTVVTPCFQTPVPTIEILQNFKPKRRHGKNLKDKYREFASETIPKDSTEYSFQKKEVVMIGTQSVNVGFDGKIKFTQVGKNMMAQVTVTSYYPDGNQPKVTTNTQTILIKGSASALAISGLFCPSYFLQNKIEFSMSDSLFSQMVTSYKENELLPVIFAGL